jgi:hypothetical protein
MSASRATTLRDLAPKELFTVPGVRAAIATRRSGLRTGAGASWLDSSNDYATATILASTRPKNRSATSVAFGRWRTARRNADGYSRRCSIASGKTAGRSSPSSREKPSCATSKEQTNWLGVPKEARCQKRERRDSNPRLRRDRPVRLATIDAQSLYSCGLPDFSRRDSAWLSQADLGRLLPVCCPGGVRRVRGARFGPRTRTSPAVEQASRSFPLRRESS